MLCREDVYVNWFCCERGRRVAAEPWSARPWLDEAWARRGWLVADLTEEADAMHALLVKRADKLVGGIEDSEEYRELGAMANAVEAYESKRWPEGKIPGGKG